jgi:hypothetical protein
MVDHRRPTLFAVVPFYISQYLFVLVRAQSHAYLERDSNSRGYNKDVYVGYLSLPVTQSPEQKWI